MSLDKTVEVYTEFVIPANIPGVSINDDALRSQGNLEDKLSKS